MALTDYVEVNITNNAELCANVQHVLPLCMLLGLKKHFQHTTQSRKNLK